MLTRFLTMDLLSEGKWIRWSHPKYQFDKITKNEPRKIITWPKTQRDTTKNTSHLCHTSKFVRKGQETFDNDEIGHRSRDLVTQAVTLSHEISSCIKRYCETYRICSRKNKGRSVISWRWSKIHWIQSCGQSDYRKVHFRQIIETHFDFLLKPYNFYYRTCYENFSS